MLKPGMGDSVIPRMGLLPGLPGVSLPVGGPPGKGGNNCCGAAGAAAPGGGVAGVVAGVGEAVFGRGAQGSVAGVGVSLGLPDAAAGFGVDSVAPAGRLGSSSSDGLVGFSPRTQRMGKGFTVSVAGRGPSAGVGVPGRDFSS